MSARIAGWALLIILFLGVAGVEGEEPRHASEFAIEGLRPSYRMDESIGAEVLNRSKRSVHFYCSAETKRPDGWEEVVLSIDAERASKAVATKKIGPSKRAAVVWKPAEQLKIYGRFDAGSYRLVLRVSELERPGKVVETVYSQPFMLTSGP